MKGTKRGYSVVGTVTYGQAVTGNAQGGPTVQQEVHELTPYSQTLPSPGGDY